MSPPLASEYFNIWLIVEQERGRSGHQAMIYCYRAVMVFLLSASDAKSSAEQESLIGPSVYCKKSAPIDIDHFGFHDTMILITTERFPRHYDFHAATILMLM